MGGAWVEGEDGRKKKLFFQDPHCYTFVTTIFKCYV